ncbi:MAG: prepilin-type N-terminal cleavage/methylation domain-containing protein [Oceanobacter sp.]
MKKFFWTRSFTRPFARRPLYRRAGGFTLIELVMVILIVGIIGVISTRIVSQSVLGWIDTSEREGLASPGNAAAEQLVREIRRALPNSVRLFSTGSYTCLELVPVISGSQYLNAPVLLAGTTLDAFEFPVVAAGEQGYVAIYPHSEDAVYIAGDAVSDSLATLGAISNHQQALTFAASEVFPAHSPQRHVYLVGEPLSFCGNGAGQLWRYSDYGFHADSSAQFNTGNAVLMLDPLVIGATDFTISTVSQDRHAIVRFAFTMTRSDGSEPQTFVREVQLKNVP